MKNIESDNEMNNPSDEIIKDIASWAIMFNIFHVAHGTFDHITKIYAIFIFKW